MNNEKLPIKVRIIHYSNRSSKPQYAINIWIGALKISKYHWQS